MPSARARAGAKAPKLGGGTVTLDDTAFGARFNMPLVHQIVRAELNARRRGTASTKTRGEVAGGGAKPWRQKGTGRARAGSSRSPLWAGGGITFGPTPRRYTFKVNRKERRSALRSALSLHAERQSLAVFDATAFSEPSTAQAVHLLNDWDPAEPILVVLGAEESAAGKSFRNLARTEALPVEDVGVADLVAAASLLVSETAMTTLVARAGDAPAASPSEAPRAPDADPDTPAPEASASDADAPASASAEPTPDEES